MKTIKNLLAVSILSAAGAANAVTVHTTNFYGSSSASVVGGTFGHYDYLEPGADGSADASGGVFYGKIHFSTDLSPGPDGAQADVTYKFTIDALAGTASSQIIACENVKLQQCGGGGFPTNLTATYLLDSYDFSDLSHITWAVHNALPSAQLGGDIVTTTFNWSGYAVPVPASAWLFGSGLIGLAGAARRRRA